MVHTSCNINIIIYHLSILWSLFDNQGSISFTWSTIKIKRLPISFTWSTIKIKRLPISFTWSTIKIKMLPISFTWSTIKIKRLPISFTWSTIKIKRLPILLCKHLQLVSLRKCVYIFHILHYFIKVKARKFLEICQTLVKYFCILRKNNGCFLFYQARRV